MDEIYIGVDIGGTNIRAACADSRGTILSIVREPTQAGLTPDNFDQKVIGTIGGAVRRLPEKYQSGFCVRTIGIGIPGVYTEGKLLLCPNIAHAQVQRLLGHFQAKGIPVRLLNDVKCAAMGEKWKGAARRCDDFVFINIGTGISAALYLDGRLYMGRDKCAGEIGYWLTGPGQTEGFRAGRAPLEEKLGGRCLTENVNRRLREKGESAASLGTREIFHDYARRSPVVQNMLDETMQYLRMTLANLSILLNPDLIVLDGGVTRDLRSHFDEFQSFLARTVPFPPEIRGSDLDGLAGLYGAIRLAIDAGADEKSTAMANGR